MDTQIIQSSLHTENPKQTPDRIDKTGGQKRVKIRRNQPTITGESRRLNRLRINRERSREALTRVEAFDYSGGLSE